MCPKTKKYHVRSYVIMSGIFVGNILLNHTKSDLVITCDHKWDKSC